MPHPIDPGQLTPALEPGPPRGPAYRIETERLVLRPFGPADAADWRALLDANDAHLRPWIPWMADEPMSLAATAQRLRRIRADFDLDRNYRYALLTRGDDTLIGMGVLLTRSGPGSLEAGYLVDQDHAGQGYATEATRAMVRVAFEVHGVDRVDIVCDPGNEPSNRIPERLGFGHEATLRRHGRDSEGEWADSAIWSLFAGNYASTPSKQADIRAFDAAGQRIPCRRA